MLLNVIDKYYDNEHDNTVLFVPLAYAKVGQKIKNENGDSTIISGLPIFEGIMERNMMALSVNGKFEAKTITLN